MYFMYFREKRSFYRSGTDTRFDSLFSFDSLMLDSEALIAFLKIGYVPGERTLFNNIFCVVKEQELPFSARNRLAGNQGPLTGSPSVVHTQAELKNILLGALDKNYTCGKKQVVPLSGGMDSRIILAAMLEFTEASNINTYTFGAPGAYDFEIPNALAKKFGTNHDNFAANDTLYDICGLVRAAKASDGNTEVFHPLVLNKVADHYGDTAVFWSGFAGDLVGGAFGDNFSGNDPKKVLLEYEKRDIYFLDHVRDDYVFPLVTSGEKMFDCVSAAEACFWENHVERYTGHHIFRNDMAIEAPLVDPAFLNFFFSLPPELRSSKKYFNESFSLIFPDFFELPTKDYGYQYSSHRYKQAWHRAKFYCTALGWRIAPSVFTHPNASYIDMQHAINNRKDVAGCVDILLGDLARRDIELIDKKKMFAFLSMHRAGKANYTKDIINLASLEVILKAANL